MILCLSLGFGLGLLAAVSAYERRPKRYARFRVVVDYPHQDSTLT